MAAALRLVLAQLNFLVGDVRGNTRQIIAAAERARDELQADAILFPELALTGYPPEDLLLRPGLHIHVLESLEYIKKTLQGIHVIVGHPHETTSGLHNSASVIYNGEILATSHKHHLPNYLVFDEMRYFAPGPGGSVFDIKGARLGLTICEDIWNPGPARSLQEAGADIILNINASPYHVGKSAEREAAVRDRVTDTGLPIVYVNLVGGQDELVFDGESFVMDAEGRIAQRAPACEEGLFVADFTYQDSAPRSWNPVPGEVRPLPDTVESVYRVLVLGVRDYVTKNRFRGAVLGLSGGIDSAVTLAIAAAALGPDQIETVLMPSRYTADISVEDAREEAENLGVMHRLIPIEKPFNAFMDVLEAEFAGQERDVTEENIQARCRGIILMAISNKFGKMLLTTGNKSEVAVGYSTLYGDMAGGFAPIKDVPKTLVYRVAEYINRDTEIIPPRVIERPPSAELAPDQRDEDSLPPYPVLDAILERYVERDMGISDIVAEGYDEAVVRRVVWLVDKNEYKRRQAPPGVRITGRAFGRDRRYPITSGYLTNQLQDKQDV